MTCPFPFGRLHRLGGHAGLWIALFAMATGCGSAHASGASPDDDSAAQILAATNTTGGLIVHLGCGAGKRTASLRPSESYVVHGLDTDAHKVQQARDRIRALGVYGPVSVAHFDAARLPYADNLVNLLVAEDMGRVTAEEAMRVLAPGGVLYRRRGNRWRKHVKPRPDNIDQWTHYLHDASGNPVAHDEIVGPPRHVQWVAGPRHTRSHEHIPSIYSVVSAGGRIFYIEDETPAASIRETPRWRLVARDAFNGTLLWQQPIAEWFPHIVNWGQTPRQLQRKLVAVGDRVYVTLGLHAPLAAVDAVSGQVRRVYENTAGTEEILWHQGVLLLVVRDVTDGRTDELAKWAKLLKIDGSPVYARETAESLVARLRKSQSEGAKSVLAIHADTGRVLWTRQGTDVAGLRTNSLCADADRVFYQNGKAAVCLDLTTGNAQWSVPSVPLRLVSGDQVYCAGGETVTARSVETGDVRWTQQAAVVDVRDLFVAGGSLWVGGFKPCPGKRGPSWGPYFATQRDLSTGEMQMHVEPANPGHHHRCFSNKATDRYILGGRRGVEFIDLQTGDLMWHSWVRGVCKYGVMPCNGLLYAPPHACACYVSAKLTGFHALSSGPPRRPTASSDRSRVNRGPAFDAQDDVPPASPPIQPAADWPTYRHDAQRSGSIDLSVSAELRPLWQADVGGKLTSPTVAGGKLFVAVPDEHRLVALDADTGKPCWDFSADARIDTPPTLDRGKAIFGCRDGCVYSLRTSDGAVAWRREAGDPRCIMVDGQLESVRPVHGSVLTHGAAAYVVVGRSSYLDGGMDLVRLDPAGGKTLSRETIYSPDPETGKQPEQFGPSAMPGALSDLLTADDDYVYLRDTVFDGQGIRQPEGNPHLLTLTGFLDDSWAHRSYWIFGKECSISTGCSGRDRNLIYGRLIVFDDSMVYGYGRRTVHWSNRLQDGPYRLFAVKRGETAPAWEKRLPIHVRAMLRTGKILFIAGPDVPSGEATDDPVAHRPGRLMAVSATDGTILAQYPLASPPVFDALAAARGRLFVSLEGGRVVCMGP